jgi:hypothetical protein
MPNFDNENESNAFYASRLEDLLSEIALTQRAARCKRFSDKVQAYRHPFKSRQKLLF